MKYRFPNHVNVLILLTIIAGWIITATGIEPFLHYHFQQIGFPFTFDFFKGFLSKSGGVADYISVFLSQFFYFNYWGSLIIVSIAALQGFIANSVVKRLTGITSFGFIYFTAIVFFGILVFTDYRYPYYATVRLLIAFIFTWIFLVTSPKSLTRIFLTWPVLAILLFYLAGGAALLVFAISTALIVVYRQKSPVSFFAVLIFPSIAMLIPLIGYKFVFGSVLSNLYRIVEVRPPQMLAYTASHEIFIYYLLLPLILLSVFFVKRKNLYIAQNVKNEESGRRKKFHQTTEFNLSVQLVLILVFGAVLFANSFDKEKKKLIYIEYYAETEQWQEIIEKAFELEKYDFRVNFHINRAYSRLGQLPDNLFDYPQLLGSKGLFFDTSVMNGSFTMPLSDIYFDLGMMSEALHWAFEAQTLLPESPRILKRLVMIYLVNEKYELAEKFLKVLGQNILCRDWVEEYSEYVLNPKLADQNKLISEKRTFSPQKRAISTHPFDNLKLLFETNKKNKLAFDYIIAHSILDLNETDFIRYVKGYRYYGIQTLPRSWAQMMSMYILKHKGLPDFADNYTVSGDCLQEFTELNEIVKQFNGNKGAAHETIKRNFENTYWYYWMYLNPEITTFLNSLTQIE